ncbi:expressed unknown protein [Seminavis robusta]|uniref:Uncharacterized protein n=1 Tax=Seminavis robusta TaxID=568900 RepID=A0A9N8F0M6_9STRA|nr:expressed unknown protein [Seminavis robusta]|eukprot:Sro2381_g325521.1  (205) ;mRNA; f:10560-11174
MMASGSRSMGTVPVRYQYRTALQFYRTGTGTVALEARTDVLSLSFTGRSKVICIARCGIYQYRYKASAFFMHQIQSLFCYKNRCPVPVRSITTISHDLMHCLLYEQADQVPLSLVNSIFKRPLEDQMEMAPSDIKAWLSNWMPVVAKASREQQQLGAAFHEAAATLDQAFGSDLDLDDSSVDTISNSAASSSADDRSSTGRSGW